MDKVQKGVQIVKTSAFNQIVKLINSGRRDNLNPDMMLYGIEKIVENTLLNVEDIKDRCKVES